MQPRAGISRRAVIGGAAALAGVVTVATLRKPDRGGPHGAYFQNLANSLAAAGIGHPVLVIDRARLAANIEAVRATLAPTKLALRIVVKSLPARGLIETIANGLGSNRFMAFNGPMLLEILRWRPDADVLLGKPLAPLEVSAICRELQPMIGNGPGPQWLAGSIGDIEALEAVARAHGMYLRVNLEIDVGLHRGGFSDPRLLRAALGRFEHSAALRFSGFMGYDAHVPKMLRPAQAYADALACYRKAMDVLRTAGSMADQPLTLNTAGSPTYRLHVNDPFATEVAVGSAFVKPSDFDLPTLDHHVPAAFVATPVLKALEPFRVPGLERIGPLMRFMDANSARAFFIHGGHWLAEPVSPPGLEFSKLYGRSSNQELLTGSTSVPLKPGDYVFFRPTQSEAVFLQFGDLCVFDGTRISERWPPFSVSA